MDEREKLKKWIKFRVRSLGMLEVQKLLEEKYISRLDEMDMEELKRLVELLEMDDWDLRRKLLEED